MKILSLQICWRQKKGDVQTSEVISSFLSFLRKKYCLFRTKLDSKDSFYCYNQGTAANLKIPNRRSQHIKSRENVLPSRRKNSMQLHLFVYVPTAFFILTASSSFHQNDVWNFLYQVCKVLTNQTCWKYTQGKLFYRF